MLINSSIEPDILKYVLCEKLASFYGLPVDYIYEEFVNPDNATLEQVQFVLSRFNLDPLAICVSIWRAC
jgi:hypothetical protein